MFVYDYNNNGIIIEKLLFNINDKREKNFCFYLINIILWGNMYTIR